MATDSVENVGDGAEFLAQVRTPFADTRKYYVATFPNAPRDADGRQKQVYPEFGTKAFPAPIHMKVEEAEQNISDHESEDEEEDMGYRRFRRRRVYRSRQEAQWVLSDKRHKNTMIGQVEGQTARYYCIVPPPPGSDEPFRIMPVHEWLSFKKPPNFKPLSASEVKAMQESKSSNSKIMELMESRKQKLQDELDAQGAIENTRGLQGQRKRRQQNAEMNNDDGGFIDIDLDHPEDLLHSDDDQDIRERVGGRSGGIKINVDDERLDDDEEDIDVLAIDRKGAGRGEGNGDADFEENFEDDEDDAAIINEADQQIANEDSLIQGAEEVRDALSEDEMDDDDEIESDQDAGVNSQAADGLPTRTLEDAAEEEHQRSLSNGLYSSTSSSKIIEEENDQAKSAPTTTGIKRPADDSKSSQNVKRARLTPQDAFKEAVFEFVRTNGGAYDAEDLYAKTANNKELVSKIGLRRKEARKLIGGYASTYFTSELDPITAKPILRLKSEFI